MGIDGVGWGTAVTKDRVWITSFNGKILVMDFDGKPVAKESDFPFKEKFLGLMGIGVVQQAAMSGLPMARTISCSISPAADIKDGKHCQGRGAEVAIRHRH